MICEHILPFTSYNGCKRLEIPPTMACYLKCFVIIITFSHLPVSIDGNGWKYQTKIVMFPEIMHEFAHILPFISYNGWERLRIPPENVMLIEIFRDISHILSFTSFN